MLTVSSSVSTSKPVEALACQGLVLFMMQGADVSKVTRPYSMLPELTSVTLDVPPGSEHCLLAVTADGALLLTVYVYKDASVLVLVDPHTMTERHRATVSAVLLSVAFQGAWKERVVAVTTSGVASFTSGDDVLEWRCCGEAPEDGAFGVVFSGVTCAVGRRVITDGGNTVVKLTDYDTGAVLFETVPVPKRWLQGAIAIGCVSASEWGVVGAKFTAVGHGSVTVHQIMRDVWDGEVACAAQDPNGGMVYAVHTRGFCIECLHPAGSHTSAMYY